MKPRFAPLIALLLPLALFADPWEDELKAFLPKFRGGDAKARAEAVRSLAQHNRKEGMEFLVELYLSEADAGVQTAFEEKIGGTIDGPGRARFYEICQGGRLPTAQRARLVRILGRGGFRDLIEVLRGLTRDAEPLVRSAAYEAIGACGFHSMEPVARGGLGDAEPDVRIAAARVLGKFRSEESVSALVKILEEDLDGAVKVAAGDALGEISGQTFGTEAGAWKTWVEGRKGLRVAQPEVDRALDRASQWLLKLRPDGYGGTEETLELELYALIHCGVALDHKNVKTAIEGLYRKPMTRTYNVSLGAMALADISPSAHQPWLVRAAAFLANSQASNGQFGYGLPIPGDVPTPAPAHSGTRPEFGTGTKTLKRVVVRQNPKRAMGKEGDNSNTQYAVLGLRACAEAAVEVPKEVWLDVLGYLKQSQTNDGGFGYSPPSAGTVYGSIHTSALGAYIVARYFGGFGTKRDAVIDKGLDWLARNFAVDENPKRGSPREWLLYYYYGMERVGILADTEFFGTHEWYQAGARYLLRHQTADGHWNNDSRDTSWAILFLRRATRPVGKVEDK